MESAGNVAITPGEDGAVDRESQAGARSVQVAPTAFGPAGVGFENGAIARLWLPGYSEMELRRLTAAWAPEAGQASDTGLGGRIERYFMGEPVDFPDAVSLGRCSIFSRKVYTILRSVKWGKTVTYRQLARMAGRPGAARVVGNIMAKNPIPLVIPCHRVVRSDGKLGGFSVPGGVALKQKMLDLEKTTSARLAYLMNA